MGGLALIVAACVGPSSRPEEPAEPDSRPSFLIVLADDMAWCDAGFAGNDALSTPHMDRLAAEGMMFHRAFTVTAMCAPSRQALYTGLFPVRSGAHPNHSRVRDGTRSMVHHLRELGYRVGLVGKKHFGPAESFPFDRIEGGTGPGVGARVRDYVTVGRGPWCVVVASSHPHAPWTAGDAEGVDTPDTATLRLPPPLVDSPATRDAFARYSREICCLDRELGECLDVVDELGQRERTVVLFTSEQGPQFPGGKWTCYDYGLRTAMVLRWPNRIDAGRESDAMVQYVDVLPTLLELAGADPTALECGCPDADGAVGFDGKSFAPVLRGETDAHRDLVYGVHTTRGIIQGHPYPIRSVRGPRYKLIENLLPDARFRNVETVEDRQGYWSSWVGAASTDLDAARKVERYQRRPPRELYDVLTDPFEQQNLAQDKQHAERIEELAWQLAEWMRQQGDLGVETELAVEPHRSVR